MEHIEVGLARGVEEAQFIIEHHGACRL